MGEYRERLIGGMVRRGYHPELAERVFKQIEGFGSYGFPESHAASFAHLAYASSWLKCHHPAVFAAALLNSQPMGFYAPAQIVRDAREHGVSIRPLDVNASLWDCALEPEQESTEGYALRLGLRLAQGLSARDGQQIVKARSGGNGSPFASPRRWCGGPTSAARRWRRWRRQTRSGAWAPPGGRHCGRPRAWSTMSRPCCGWQRSRPRWASRRCSGSPRQTCPKRAPARRWCWTTPQPG
ncbi:hypothetical protein ACFQU7_35725 [Pseudoroseomonas wenyumeiae]